MTAIADLTALLLSTGLSADKVAAAIDLAQRHAIESADIRRQSADSPVDNAAERRRAYDRERQKIRRQSADSAKRASSLSSSPTSQEIPKEVSKKERARGTKLPDDWRPTPDHYAEGERLGMSAALVDEAATDLRLWAAANSNRSVARKSNWDLTFSTWLRRNRSPPRPNGYGGAPRHGSREDTRERTVRALDKLTDYIAAHSDDEGGSGETRQTPIGLLPFAKPA